jgi:hypothetical protein
VILCAFCKLLALYVVNSSTLCIRYFVFMYLRRPMYVCNFISRYAYTYVRVYVFV